MYTVSFDVGRFQRKRDGAKRRTRAPASEIVYVHTNASSCYTIAPLGAVTYELLNVNFSNQANVDAFARRWRVTDFLLPRWGEVRVSPCEVVSSGAGADLEWEQSKISTALSLWLSVDTSSTKTTPRESHQSGGGVDIDSSGATPAGRFKTYPMWQKVSARIGLWPFYRMSERTWQRQQAKLKRLDEEVDSLGMELDGSHEQLRWITSEVITPASTEQWQEADPEVAFADEFEERDRIMKELSAKRNEYRKERERGWDVTVAYDVPDIISICWLEIFTCVQYGILARRCSLCQRQFIVTGRANMRQCPECRKNPAKAWRKANESVLNKDGSSEG